MRLLQYMFLGYAGRTQSKILWPLVAVHVAPEEGADGYLQRALQEDLENEFTVRPENASSFLASQDRRLTLSLRVTSCWLPT